MYGIKFWAIEAIITEEYGAKIWRALAAKTGLGGGCVVSMRQYSDDLIFELAEAAMGLFGNGTTVNDCLAYFGRCFIRSAHQCGHKQSIQARGRYFSEFLIGIDNIHLNFRYTYPKMKQHFITVIHEDGDGVVLNYRTTRKGLSAFLFGILDQVARDFFNLKISVPELPLEPNGQTDDEFRYILRVNFDNRDYMEHMSTRKLRNLELDSLLAPVSSNILLQLFPFVFVFNAELTIVAIGNTLRQMYPGNALMGKNLLKVARMRRPKVILSWNNCRILEKAMCELEVLPDYVTSNSAVDFLKQRRLILRGQLRYEEDWKAIMFLCNPLINNLEDMQELDISLSELSLHGNSRELIMTGQQHYSKLEDLYERAEERAKQLALTHELHDEWKKRGDELLYSMIPKPIAEQLSYGIDPFDTCKAYDCVTVLFLDITNFEVLSAAGSPFAAVSCMNNIFSCLDNIIDQHSVYKVETVGQVYMVVGGAPEESLTHVRDVALVSLDFRNKLESLLANIDMKVHLRFGFHSGPTVGGIVGRKVPRYCLFGDTINVASRMQTCSVPGRIQLSKKSHELLKKFEGFKCEIRGTVFIKGKGDMVTYWLESYAQPLQNSDG